MKIRFVEAFAVRVPRDIGAATGLAGSPTVLAGGKGDYRWSQDYSALYSTNFAPCDGRPFIFVNFHLEGIRIGPSGSIRAAASFPAQILQEASTVPGNDSALPTAHYTAGPEENRARNTGEKGLDRVRTAQNAHSGVGG